MTMVTANVSMVLLVMAIGIIVVAVILVVRYAGNVAGNVVVVKGW
jgi:hypothetical protein